MAAVQQHEPTCHGGCSSLSNCTGSKGWDSVWLFGTAGRVWYGMPPADYSLETPHSPPHTPLARV